MDSMVDYCENAKSVIAIINILDIISLISLYYSLIYVNKY